MRKHIALLISVILMAGIACGNGSITVNLGDHVTSVTVSYFYWNSMRTEVCTEASTTRACDWEDYRTFTFNDPTFASGYEFSRYRIIEERQRVDDNKYVTNFIYTSSGTYTTTDPDGDATCTLEAYARPITNSITYVLNGGANSPDAPTSYTVESPTVTLPSNGVTRSGHTFAGWTNESGVVVAAIPTGSTGNKTFYAKWNASSYTVTFDANGGTVSPVTESVTYNSVYGELPNPTRTGYSFGGWWTQNGSNNSWGTQVTAATVVSATLDHTLYAKWQAESYTLTINPNGGRYNGSAGYTQKQVTFDSTLNNSIGKPSYDGHVFEGWYMQYKGGVSNTLIYDANGDCVAGDWWSDSGTFKATNHPSVIAKWTASTYSIRFNANGGNGTMEDQAMAYGTAENLTSNTFTRIGHTFTGWATSASGNVVYSDGQSVTNLSTTQGAVVELYAKWTAKSYTLNINPNHGTYNGSAERTQKQVTFGSTLNNSIGKPTRTGYVFGGWYEQIGGSRPNTNKLPVYDANGYCVAGGGWWSASGSSGTFQGTIDPSVIAEWTAGTNTVSFNVNGGSGEFDSISVTYGSTYGTLPTPTRTGHTFVGWWTARDGGSLVTANTTVTITSSQTLYAHWTANVYSVTLHFDGGWITWNGTEQQITSSPFVTNYTYGTGLSLPSFGKTGYTAGGWHLAEDGSDPATYSIGTSDSGDKVFWAKFTARSYNVTLDNQGADVGGTSSVSVMFGGDFPSPITRPEKIGYAFGGYFAQAEGQGTQYYKDDGTRRGNPWTTAADGTIYANWLPNDYTVRFNPGDGGTGVISDMALKYGVETNLPTIVELGFTREGYVFAGWTNGTDNAVFADGQMVSNLTAEANATVDMYAVWSRGYYYVDFNANGGEGTMETQKFTYDVPAALATNAFTRAGYDFAGWAWNSNATTNDIVFTNCETVVNIASVVDSTNTLYAVWAAESYTVVLNANEAEGTDGYFLDGDVTNYFKEVTVTYGTPYNLPEPLPRQSWKTFAGWKYIDGQTSTAQALPATVPLSSAGVTNIVAQWVDGLKDALNAEGTDLEYSTGGYNNSQGVQIDTGWSPTEKDGVTGELVEVGQSGTLPANVNSSYTYVRTTLPGRGVLTFTWRLYAQDCFKVDENIPWGNSLSFVDVSSDLQLVPYLATGTGNDYASKTWRDTGWQVVSFTNDAAAELSVEWRFAYSAGKDGGGTGWVDNVTWTPAGGLSPGKVPFGENGASPMTVGDGQTSVSIANTVKGWWYGLYSKTNLADTAEQWIPLEARQATSDDELISFDWLWNPAEPQRFFKIRLSEGNPCQ